MLALLIWLTYSFFYRYDNLITFYILGQVKSLLFHVLEA